MTLTLYVSRAIVELSARRFDVLKMKLSVLACDGFTDVASNVLTVKDYTDKRVREGKMTRKEADKDVADETQDAIRIVQRVRLVLF